MKKPLVIIAGPTASGKTHYSVQLAKKINGEIISADSMQVYRWMDIGTAKIKKEEMEGIPHHLIDILNPDEEFNVMIFQQRAKEALKSIYEKNKIPILVGGTGFYINAFVNDNYFMETKEKKENSEIRNSFYQLAEEHGADALYKKLEKIDPAYAKTVHANNIKRVARALEFYYLSGIRFSDYNKEEKQKKSPYQTAFFILNQDRNKLYEKINLRVDNMIRDGLVEEVQTLLNRGCSPELVSMQGLGYKEIIPYLKGTSSLENCIEELKKRTRHFAKKQLTWFRGQTEGIWIDVSNREEDTVLNQMMDYLQKQQIGKNNEGIK